MAVNEILTRYQQIADSFTLQFLSALISSEKMRAQYKNMKWGDYLKMRDSATNETSSTAIVPSKSRAKKLTVTSNLFDQILIETTYSSLHFGILRQYEKKPLLPWKTVLDQPRNYLQLLPNSIPLRLLQHGCQKSEKFLCLSTEAQSECRP